MFLDETQELFVISDTHFNHSRIIEYCSRPFLTSTSMDLAMVDRWNKVVSKRDVVIHLGDFGLGAKEYLKQIIKELNGEKYLVLGNHDRLSATQFKQAGFKEVFTDSIVLTSQQIVFSHRPLPDSDIPMGFINVHGHIHNCALNSLEYPIDQYTPARHINVSADVQQFFPMPLLQLLGKERL